MAIWTLLQPCVLPFLLLAFVLSATVSLSLGDRGTAARYEPSPSRTQYCGDPSQFPKDKNLAFVTKILFDSGIACWREYDLQCDGPPFCKAGSGPVRYIVAGLAADIPEGVDFALPPDSFGAIANPNVNSFPMDYKEA